MSLYYASTRGTKRRPRERSDRQAAHHRLCATDRRRSATYTLRAIFGVCIDQPFPFSGPRSHQPQTFRKQASRASAPCRSKRGRGELDSIADTRRESAPSTLGGGASSASADTQAQCWGCCASDATSRQEEWAKVYYVRKDVVASQSDLFRELVQAQQVESGEIGSRTARMIEVALTLPDATSFGVLLDYFESGDFGRISSAMESGEARWESVMLNARHLRVSEVLKMQLGAWWRHQQGRMHRGSLPASAVPPPHATQAHISSHHRLGLARPVLVREPILLATEAGPACTTG